VQAVEHVAAQRMARRQGRMVEIEILGRVSGHAEPFHDTPGAQVAGHGNRDDLGKANRQKPSSIAACAASVAYPLLQ